MSRPCLHSSDDEIPLTIPNHTLYRRIGRGSSGEVWLATDAMNKWRAVKVVSRRQDGRRDHGYHREFNAIKKYEEICHHDGSLMPILTVGRDSAGRYFFYTMELADDATHNNRIDTLDCIPEQILDSVSSYKPRTLRSELKTRGRLPTEQCLEYGIALTIALEQLHIHGLIHRDIKPDNIIFAYGHPKLADVGLVADVDATYSIAGTLAYLSPEAIRKEPADIFALGKVLYEMLAGRDADEFPAPPKDFGGFSVEERAAFNELNAVVLKACDPEVNRRHLSASHLREELELLKESGSVVHLRNLEERDRQRRRFIQRLAGSFVMVGCLLLFSFLAFYTWTARRSVLEEARRRELREIKISRFTHRLATWSAESWSRLERAAAVKMDEEVLEQAAALLAGVDAREIIVHRDAPVASASFGPTGQILLGGAGDSHAIMIHPNGSLTKLLTRGQGPVCWTSDGVPMQLIARANAMVFCEAENGTVRRNFLIPAEASNSNSSVRVMAMTPGGSVFGATIRDRVLVWTGTNDYRPREIAADATSIVFSPDGALLALGTADGTTRVYDTASLSELAVLPPALRGSPILCLAFGRDRVVDYEADGRKGSWLLATGDRGAAIVVWDLDRRLPRSFCLGSPWNVQSLVFHPDGLTLASAGRNEARLWDVMSGRLLLRIAGSVSAGNSQALAFDPQGRRLVFGGDPGAGRASAALWELELHRGIQVLRGLSSASRKVWFANDSRHLAALSDNWHLAIWDAVKGEMKYDFETPVGILADNAGGCFDAGNEHFAFSTGTEACLYDLKSGQAIQRWHLREGMSDQLQFDRNGRLLLLRREQASVDPRSVWRLYELTKSQAPSLLREQKEASWSVGGVAFRPGGGQFVVWNNGVNSKRFIQVHDLARGGQTWDFPLELDDGYNVQAIFDPTGRWFGYTGRSTRSKLILMDLANDKEVKTTVESFEAINPSGTQFAGLGYYYPDSTGYGGRIPLAPDWNLGKHVCAFSPNGKLLAYGTFEGPVVVADLAEVQHRLGSLTRAER